MADGRGLGSGAGRPTVPVGALRDAEAAYARVFDYLAVADQDLTGDAIVCFGSDDPDVPGRAAELFHRGAAPLVLVTGGRPMADGRCEADTFADE
ncbi:MAG: hypothetical protein AB7L84_08585, partial [Acidimicrobiia bacterium]